MSEFVSKQRLWQYKMEKEGRCIQCGKAKELETSQHCNVCREKRKVREQNKALLRKQKGIIK